MFAALFGAFEIGKKVGRMEEAEKNTKNELAKQKEAFEILKQVRSGPRKQNQKQ